MILKRAPQPSTTSARIIQCASRFCDTELNSLRVVEFYRGYGYCSRTCRKDWPPVINKIQSLYKAPIEVVLFVSLKLFRSRRRVAEVLDIPATTLDKLYIRFDIA
jgi:hypothetical protein